MKGSMLHFVLLFVLLIALGGVIGYNYGVEEREAYASDIHEVAITKFVPVEYTVTVTVPRIFCAINEPMEEFPSTEYVFAPPPDQDTPDLPDTHIDDDREDPDDTDPPTNGEDPDDTDPPTSGEDPIPDNPVDDEKPTDEEPPPDDKDKCDNGHGNGADCANSNGSHRGQDETSVKPGNGKCPGCMSAGD